MGLEVTIVDRKGNDLSGSLGGGGGGGGGTGGAVTIVDGGHDTFGTRADAPVANPTTAGTFMSVIRGYWTDWRARVPALVGGRTPVDGSGVVQPVSATALPLPAGASTEATLAALKNATFARGPIAALYYATTANAVTGSVYSVGHIIARIAIVDESTPNPTVPGGQWVNLNTLATITADPTANCTLLDLVVPPSLQTQLNNTASWQSLMASLLNVQYAAPATVTATGVVATIVDGSKSTYGFSAKGTAFVGTLQAFTSSDGSTYDIPLTIRTVATPGVSSVESSSLAYNAAAAFNDAYFVQGEGFGGVQIRCTAFTSGSVTVTMSATDGERVIGVRGSENSPVPTKTQALNSSTVATSVRKAVTSSVVQLLAAGRSAAKFTLQPETATVLLVRFGTEDVTATNYTYLLQPNQPLYDEAEWKGRVTCMLVSGTGNVQVTEFGQ